MFPTGVIRVICITEQPLIQYAVECQFKAVQDMELMCGASLSDFELLALQHRPRVAILELQFPLAHPRTTPESPPLEQILQRIQDALSVEILVVAGRLEPTLLAGLDDLRIHGYLLKNDPRTLRLPEAVRALALGGTIYSERVIQARQAPPEGEDNEILTSRQLEILNAILTEPNQAYIQHAERLGITDSTFDTHLYNIYRKLGVNTLTAAVIRALQMELLPLPPLPAKQTNKQTNKQTRNSRPETS